jgi:histo-blood group ABO system transferase
MAMSESATPTRAWRPGVDSTVTAAHADGGRARHAASLSPRRSAWPMKICVITIATGNYVRFLPVLRASIAWRFLVGHDVRHLIFTDCDIPPTDTIRVVRIPHEPWPLPTLRRYDHFRAARDILLEHEFCFYLDADMRMDRPVGDEILGERVATRHPYQSLLTPARMSFERDPRSRACVEPTEGTMYYAGGFNGGSARAFVAMAEALADAIARDQADGITA